MTNSVHDLGLDTFVFLLLYKNVATLDERGQILQSPLLSFFLKVCHDYLGILADLLEKLDKSDKRIDPFVGRSQIIQVILSDLNLNVLNLQRVQFQIPTKLLSEVVGLPIDLCLLLQGDLRDQFNSAFLVFKSLPVRCCGLITLYKVFSHVQMLCHPALLDFP